MYFLMIPKSLKVHQICIRIILHKNQLPFSFLIQQTLRPSIFHLIVWCIGQSVCNSYSVSGGNIHLEILSFIIYIDVHSLSSISYENKKITVCSQYMGIRNGAYRSIFIRRMAKIMRKMTCVVGLVNMCLTLHVAIT